jgi:hypothetical protein
LEIIEELFILKTKAVIQLFIHLGVTSTSFWLPYEEESQAVERLMELIVPVLLRLHQAGRRVIVELDHIGYYPEAKLALANWLKRIEEQA